MFEFSFSDLFEKAEEDYPLLSAIDFGKIEQLHALQTITPVSCVHCGAIVFDYNDFRFENEEYTFTCRFCVEENKIPKKIAEEYIKLLKINEKKEEMAFILEEEKNREQNKEDLLNKMNKEAHSTFYVLNAIIDVSGSMAGTKIEAVKQSLVKTIHIMGGNDPNCLFMLAEFESNVRFHPNPKKSIIIDEGPVMYNQEMLLNEVNKIMDKNSPKKISETWKEWQTIVKKLKPLSMTALGPAIYLALESCIYLIQKNKAKNGGKIILLTDGLANVGLGDIESNKNDPKTNILFYEQLAKKALEKNIVIDVIGVMDSNGGNNVCLNIIGKLSDITGGSMIFVESKELENAFGELSTTHFIAKNTTLWVYTPEFLDFVEIEGLGFVKSDYKRGEPIKLGAFDSTRAIYLKFKPNRKITEYHGKKSMIQIKIEYIDKSNRKISRIFEKEFDMTRDHEKFIKSFKPEIASGYEISQAQRFQKEMNLKAAKAIMHSSIKRNIAYNAMNEQNKSEKMQEIIQLQERELKHFDEMEQEAENVSDKGSFYQAKMQRSSRSSMDEKLKKLRK